MGGFFVPLIQILYFLSGKHDLSPKVRCVYNATKKIYEIHSVNGDHITKGAYEETDIKFIDGTRSQLLHDAHGGVFRGRGSPLTRCRMR